VALDGGYRERGGELDWHALGHLQTSEVGVVLERALRRIERHLRRRGLIRLADDGAVSGAEGAADPESHLAASAVSGQAPPASIARYLAAVGEATEVPRRSPSRGPPYWKSRVLRRQAHGDEDGCHSDGTDEAP